MAHLLLSPTRAVMAPSLTPHANREQRILPLAGLLLTICGLLLLGAGFPALTAPAIPAVFSIQPSPSALVIAPRPALTPIRLAWSVPHGNDAAGRAARTTTWTGTGITFDGTERSVEQFPARWIGRPERATFADWDLRLVLRDMALQQRRSVPAALRTCTCPPAPPDKGSR